MGNRFVVVDHEPNWEIHDNVKHIVLGEVTNYCDAELFAMYLNTMWVCIKDLDKLTMESEGVIGLHLNGDVATWEDIIDGAYSEWLGSFEDALNV